MKDVEKTSKKAKEAPKEKEVIVEGVETATTKIPIRGSTSLICNRFSDVQKQQIADKQGGVASSGRKVKDVEQCYKDSAYVLPDGRHGFPASGFKNAMVTACAFTKKQFPKTLARGAFHIIGDMLPVKGNLVKRNGGKGDIVRLQGMGHPADIRYRMEFEAGWEAELPIVYNKRAITVEQLAQLLTIAGFSVGVGDWRPETDGNHGMFELKK
jgi:hypothetical protein